MKSESEVAQSCPTLCDPVDCSLPGSSFHGIFQAKLLEWVAIFFSILSVGDMNNYEENPKEFTKGLLELKSRCSRVLGYKVNI